MMIIFVFFFSCHNFRLPKSTRTKKRAKKKKKNNNNKIYTYIVIEICLGSFFRSTRLVNKFVFTFFVYVWYLNSLWSSWARESYRWGPIDCSKWIPLAGKFFCHTLRFYLSTLHSSDFPIININLLYANTPFNERTNESIWIDLLFLSHSRLACTGKINYTAVVLLSRTIVCFIFSIQRILFCSANWTSREMANHRLKHTNLLHLPFFSLLSHI